MRWQRCQKERGPRTRAYLIGSNARTAARLGRQTWLSAELGVSLDAHATLCLVSSDNLRRELYYRSMNRVLRSLMLLLFLHLAVGGTDLACANHSAASAASQSAAAMVDHHAGHPGESRQHHHQSDTAPIGQPCCSAMASCSLTIATLRADGTEGIASRRQRPTSRDLAALSWATTPDTPPPRA